MPNRLVDTRGDTPVAITGSVRVAATRSRTYSTTDSAQWRWCTAAIAVAIVAVGIGFFAVLFAALWGAAALISSNSDDTTERLAPSFQEMGSYTALASVIADGGPIILPDLVGTDRHIVLDHTGAEPDSGWTIHLAHPADRDAACQIEQIKHTRQFVDCDGRTLEVDDLAEPDRLDLQAALLARRPEVAFVGCDVRYVSPEGALLGEDRFPSDHESLLARMPLFNQFAHAGCMYRTEAARAVGGALQGVLRNPMPWSILAGALAGAVGFDLWAPVGRTVALLADAASPVALFTIGAVLARAQMQAAVPAAAARPALQDVGVITVLKLLVQPALVWAGAAWAVRAGVLPQALLAPLVLTAALPSAANVSLLAERFGADNGRVARVILYSTVAAFFSFSAAVALLR